VLLGTWMWRSLYRNAKPRAVESMSNVLVGPHLSRRAARDLIGRGVTSVVDLACERAEVRELRELDYLSIPVLDWTAPDAAQVRLAHEFIEDRTRRGKTVYVHCALGRYRTMHLLRALAVSSSPSAAEPRTSGAVPFAGGRRKARSRQASAARRGAMSRTAGR